MMGRVTQRQGTRFLFPLLIAGLVGVLLPACTLSRPCRPGVATWEDGTYRGGFIDEGLIQVNLQFTLQDGILTAASFRHLVGSDPAYFLGVDVEPQRSVVQQYQEALQYLVGKPLAEHLDELYHPERIVLTQVDGYTAATLRTNKILSAIRDALNRGVYSY